MTTTSRSVLTYAIYVLGLGGTLMLAPNIPLPLFGLPQASEVWIRVAGMTVIFLGIFYVVGWDQPILENYVGRQVPTAMVARNLERGSGFLRPQLDTGPFPNLFLVEPPIYAEVVVIIRRLTRMPLERCGRITSAIGMMLLFWGMSGLLCRRRGESSDLGLFVASISLPIFLRYGRAFQPDVFALGLVLAGSRLWDAHETDGARSRLFAAWLLTAMGLAVKVSTAYALVPLIAVILRPRTVAKIALTLSTLAPAALWYVYAAWALKQPGGSRASADNAAHWLSALSLIAWTKPATYVTVARLVGWRAFGPVALPLAFWGLFRSWPEGRYWRAWSFSASVALVLLGGKLHHEYYFLALAPVIAAGLARLLQSLCPDGFGSFRAGAVVILLLWFGRDAGDRTHATPREWTAWPRAVTAIRDKIPPGEWIAAPEALLYLADRKGCRLEYQPKARVRAAGEWGATIDRADPLALVELYRSKGARYVADLLPVGDEPDRRALHDAIRRRYNVVMDRDGVIVAELVDQPK